jgi:cytochrome c oxidase assembly protein subunit 15
VVVQGLFGRWTVTLKLYPAVVTAHLLGGVLLLALLVAQFERQRQRHHADSVLPRMLIAAVWALLLLQLLLGGWVSSNYAVLACQGFPTCNGQWWPTMNFGAGFEIFRSLGRSANGDLLPFDALVAIQFAHRAFALVVLAAAALLAWRLCLDPAPSSRRSGVVLGALLLLQSASGVSNVVLGWPLLAALTHSGGAAALIALITALLVRTAAQPQPSALRAD